MHAVHGKWGFAGDVSMHALQKKESLEPKYMCIGSFYSRARSRQKKIKELLKHISKLKKERQKKMSIIENEREKNRIIKDMEKSGYPLEIKATSILESHGWNLLNQEGYLDIEKGKWRTIDILAHQSANTSNSPVYERLHVTLVVECKKSSKPWVFWVRDKKGLRMFRPLVASGLIKLESKPWLHPLHFEELADCFHYYFPEFKKIAIIPYEPFIKKEKGDGKSIVFEAKNQVLKSLLYEENQTRKFCSMEEAREKVKANFKTANSIFVLYPLIIFDGHLYELEYIERKPKLTLSRYIQFLTSFGFPTPDEFVIDIVEISFLEEYLRVLNKGIERLTKKIASLRFPSKPPVQPS